MRAKYSDVFSDETKRGHKIQTSEYLHSGNHPIIDQGQSQISGYTNWEDGIFADVPAIIFGDHTRVIKYVDTPFFLGADGVKVLKAKISDADYKYLFYCLQNAKIPNTGYNRHFKWLKEIEIPLPSPDEQRRIAAVLDKVNDLITKRRQQLDKLEELVKARFVEMFGDEQKRMLISDVCKIITDGTHQPPPFVSEGIPFLFVSNIVTNVITYDTEKYITQDTYDEVIKRTPIEIGDILLSTVGSYGHPAIVKDNRPFLFQRHIAYLKPKTEVVYSEYLYSALLSDDVQRQIEEKVKGVAQKTLNLSEIRTIIIPTPSRAKQKTFCHIVDKIGKSKLTIQQSLDKLEVLKKALMQQYFGGCR